MAEKEFYYRRLPHYHPEEATLFITFRLANSLPQSVIYRLRDEYRKGIESINIIQNSKTRFIETESFRMQYFDKFDSYLDNSSDIKWLANPEIAKICFDAIMYRDKKEYNLIAFTVMPNHIHLLFELEDQGNSDPSYQSKVIDIMKGLKQYTANQSNKILKQRGAFWQHESYDHVVRNTADMERIIKYIIHNPVKANLCNNWCDWPYTYCKYL